MTHLSILFLIASQLYALPPGLLEAVCYVESHHSPRAYNANDGGTPSYGVCQIKLGTARLLGFKGPASALQNPEINTLLAASNLRRSLDRYNGSVHKAISAYNAGSYRVNAQGETKNVKYVTKVFKVWTVK